ncbi:MAG: YncE family protein [Thaumarchaeota archaeon]|nr:YncE family protein [Nitrososphaerota archaeon]
MVSTFTVLFILLSLMSGMFVFSGTNAYAFQDSVIVGNFPRDIDIDIILNNLYVPNYESGTISVIDSENMIVIDTISINNKNSNPTQIVVDSNRHLVFVSDKISGILTIVDGINGEIIDSMSIGDSLWDLDINDKNGKLYVSDLLKNEIIIVDTKNLEIIKSIPVSSSPWSVIVNQKTGMVYVASGISETIHVIDGDTDNLLYEINSGVKSWGLSINEKNNTLYVTSWDSNSITVIDLQSNQIIYEIPIISGAWKMSTNQNNGVTIISNEHTNELYLLDADSRQFQTIILPDSPQSITVSPFSNTIYVTNPLSNSVSSVTYEYDYFESTPIFKNIILDYESDSSNLILEVVDGIFKIPQRQDIDTDLISGLLQNIGVTGEFDGNGIARLLLDDYNKKKELQPETVSVPSWTVDLAMMFTDETEKFIIPEKIDCDDISFSSIHDIDNLNPFEIWLKILPICALS